MSGAKPKPASEFLAPLTRKNVQVLAKMLRQLCACARATVWQS